jgi:hypothetical protein
LNLQVLIINELSLNKKLIVQFLAKDTPRPIKSKAKSTDGGTEKNLPTGMYKKGFKS